MRNVCFGNRRLLGQLSTFINPQADAHYQVVARDLSSQMQQLVVSTTKRLKTLNWSLSNIMGILESRRGIAEAESVTRLTEFAFFFIPITLTAGALSMQAIELKNSVPLWAFFTISFSLIMTIYATRLLIGSLVMVTFMRNCWHQVYERTEEGKQGLQVKSHRHPPGCPLDSESGPWITGWYVIIGALAHSSRSNRVASERKLSPGIGISGNYFN